MPRSRRRRPVEAGRRSGLLDVLPPLRWWWTVPGLVLFLIVFARAREHGREPEMVEGFPADDIAAAKLRIMPYRQSGLIFSWDDRGGTVFLDGSMWEALPKRTQRDLGQAMAVSRDARVVRLRDGRTHALIATCTAAGRCRDAGGEDQPEPGAAR